VQKIHLWYTCHHETYRRDLQATYGNKLRLHTYAVVAVGFERIICVET
jgi:hypothetical protein